MPESTVEKKSNVFEVEYKGEKLVLASLDRQDLFTIEEEVRRRRVPAEDVLSKAAEAALLAQCKAEELAERCLGAAEKAAEGMDEEAAEKHREKAREKADRILAHAEATAQRLTDSAFAAMRPARDIDVAEVGAFTNTIAGATFIMWLRLKKQYGDRFSLEEAGDVLLEALSSRKASRRETLDKVIDAF